MKKIIIWVVGIIVAVLLVVFIFVGGSNRQAYRTAKGAINTRTQLSQDRIDMAVQMAMKSVDLALARAGNLPSQQASADLMKQDIQEIGNRLKGAAQFKGDQSITRLDASIEQFNKTLDTVDKASKEADDPAVKAALDRIYGNLEATKEQLVQTILNTK